MLARGRGKIVFVASLLSFQGGITVPGYAASKSGDRRPDEGARERVGGRRRQRECRRTRVRHDRQHPGVARRSGAPRADPRPHSRRAGGRSRRTSPAQSSSSARPRPITCTGSCFPSTAGGSADERAVEDALGRSRVLPVVAVDDAAVVGDLCAALLEGGIACIEITFRTDAAAAAIERAADVDGMLVGAGTVLTVEQAHSAARPARASRSRRGRTTRSSARAPSSGCRSSPGSRRRRSSHTRCGSVARP